MEEADFAQVYQALDDLVANLRQRNSQKLMPEEVLFDVAVIGCSSYKRERKC